MFRHVPNLLTGLRLILAAGFFAMLGRYQYHPPSQTQQADLWWLNTAFIVYLIALVTDFLDGYLARKWKVEGAFGRVVDPFVDKVLVLGSFIFFAGKNFTIPTEYIIAETPNNVRTITGVVPWMVVVILARELLVTSLRGLAESSGKAFGAAFIGKAKMVTQSVTILVILVYVNYLRWLTEHGYQTWAEHFRNLCIWVTLAVTVWSCIGYVMKAISIVTQKPTTPNPGPQATPTGSFPARATGQSQA